MFKHRQKFLYRHHNSIALQDKYKDLFSYDSKYEFKLQDAIETPVFDKPYDIIMDRFGNNITCKENEFIKIEKEKR